MAMVNHEKRIIFLHNPKTAGTSISIALAERGFVNAWEDERWKGVEDQHSSNIADDLFDYHSFAVWRNPFDRTVSMWSFHRNFEDGDCSFLEYVKRGFFAVDKADTLLHCFHDYWTQSRYVFLARQLIAFDSINGKIAVDGLGDVPLGRHNVAPHGPWREYYDDEIAGLVLDGAAEDFAMIEMRTGLDLRETWKE